LRRQSSRSLFGGCNVSTSLCAHTSNVEISSQAASVVILCGTFGRLLCRLWARRRTTVSSSAINLPSNPEDHRLLRREFRQPSQGISGDGRLMGRCWSTRGQCEPGDRPWPRGNTTVASAITAYLALLGRRRLPRASAITTSRQWTVEPRWRSLILNLALNGNYSVANTEQSGPGKLRREFPINLQCSLQLGSLEAIIRDRLSALRIVWCWRATRESDTNFGF